MTETQRIREWPTWLLAFVHYTFWFALVSFGADLPIPVLVLLGGFSVCLHGSLQHETIHGHPTRSRFWNAAIAWPPLGLLYPYSVYRDLHLAHHGVKQLTVPNIDPESFFFSAEDWAAMGRLRRMVHRANFSLFGRLTIGPILVAKGLLLDTAGKILRGDWALLRIWTVHAVSVVALLGAIEAYTSLGALTYVLCFAWPGLALTLIRSFLEHRPADGTRARSVIVQGNALTQLIFMGVNYHWLHHESPHLPWYRMPAEFRARREEVLSANGGYYFRGYLDVARRYLFTPWSEPIHPGFQ